ncbi:MAG: cyclic nucleotide-binding and patatin-like phospholipase domain-containing protein, partial [bacterium]
MDVSSINCFRDLDPQQQARLRQSSTQIRVKGGDALISEGEASDSMYFVVSGRFSIGIASKGRPLAEIGSGQTIGEIGFLSGRPRTATATAIRDSIVLRLDRTDYDLLCESFPQMLKDVSASLAKKLAAATNAYRGQEYIIPTTITICPAGNTLIDQNFLKAFKAELSALGSCTVLAEEDIGEKFGHKRFRSEEVIQWLNEQEKQFDLVLYIAEPKDGEWTALCFRQSDQVLLIANGDVSSPEAKQHNDAERLLHGLTHTVEPWLILCHQSRGDIRGTSEWLESREVSMFHHIALNHPSTLKRLVRFISGDALGLVASGGGAYTAAHIGVFKALQEAGMGFDIVGGASGGAAMVCAWSIEASPQTMAVGIEKMMVRSGALKRFTVPVYSLVDHVYFDQCLKEHYKT